MHLKYNNEQITYKRMETIAKEGIRVTNILYILEGLVKAFITRPEGFKPSDP